MNDCSIPLSEFPETTCSQQLHLLTSWPPLLDGMLIGFDEARATLRVAGCEYDPGIGCPSDCRWFWRRCIRKYSGPVLYHFEDFRGDTLYIGITSHFARRLKQHAKEKPWWPDVAYIWAANQRDMAEAADTERFSIGEFEPRHNVTHNRKRWNKGEGMDE